MHHAYVGKLLRLTLLAPDLVEAVLGGRLRKGVKLEDLVRPPPSEWVEQRRSSAMAPKRRADKPDALLDR